MAYTIEEILEMKIDPSISDDDYMALLEEVLAEDFDFMQTLYDSFTVDIPKVNPFIPSAFIYSINHFVDYKRSFLKRVKDQDVGIYYSDSELKRMIRDRNVSSTSFRDIIMRGLAVRSLYPTTTAIMKYPLDKQLLERPLSIEFNALLMERLTKRNWAKIWFKSCGQNTVPTVAL